MHRFLLLLCFTFFFGNCPGQDIIPTLFKGRVRPLHSAAGHTSLVKSIDSTDNQEYAELLQALKQKKLASYEIANALESQFPVRDRIRMHRQEYNFLPLRSNPTEWVSLSALQLKVYSPYTDQLEMISNFTPYSDSIFQTLQANTTAIIQKKNQEETTNQLSSVLHKGYHALAGKPMIAAAGKTLFFPTNNQLLAEYYTTKFPIRELAAVMYVICVILFFTRYTRLAFLSGAIGFLLQTLTLALRCYILARPPVSNMYETMIYVPWITMIAAFILWWRYQTTIVIATAAAVAAGVLVIQMVTKMDSGMENVQAVLDSQFWLIVHVLMVVGSYGLFLLCGILGHLYLITTTWMRSLSSSAQKISQLTLQSMYIGTALLICGTVLGGIWAAQSWGRFWDWDPKESWAFISSCIYLLWIHCYRFNIMGAFGLAAGSIVGLHAIVFTWYGVNYILGTGMHSYGFGAGGEIYYYLFFGADAVFLIATLLKNWKLPLKESKYS